MSVGVVDKTTGDRIPTAGDPLDKVGNLANLTTTAKGSAVEAINEVNAGLATKQNSTDNNLQTTAKEIVPAINEINSNFTSLSSVINGYSDNLNLVRVIKTSARQTSETKHFNLAQRGAGFLLCDQNSSDSSVYAITVASDNTVTFNKIVGQTLTIDSTSASDVQITIGQWSTIVIISYVSEWNNFTPA